MINKILILVELDNGHVHQVLAPPDLKEVCVALLRSPGDSALRLSERLMPVTLETFAQAEQRDELLKPKTNG